MSLLGQLYYYDAKLKEIPEKITPEIAVSIDLCGLPTNDTSNFKGLSEADIREYLRESFAAGYNLILIQNELRWASIFWASLTSALLQYDDLPHPRTDFQRSLIEWAQNGYHIMQMSDLLAEGGLSTEVEDFALYYGLKVLFLLNLRAEVEDLQDFLQTHNLLTQSNFDAEESPSILVVCKTNLAPLFVNLNCVTLPLVENTTILADQIKLQLIETPFIKLIVIVAQEPEEIVSFLKKNLDSEIFIAGLNLDSQTNENQTYFDKLARKTLGFRL